MVRVVEMVTVVKVNLVRSQTVEVNLQQVVGSL